jgi:Trk-type K+ transport system membrane component
MTAALTLLIILAVSLLVARCSLLVVRIGGTALKLTGMSLDAARFQSISALTGTGFTTQEAETTMHHPLRRRVLIALMFTGHLGVVSLASAVILGVSTAQEGSVAWTVLYMLTTA